MRKQPQQLYWLASQCSELVVTPSGQVGSIGVFAAHEDMSKAAEIAGYKISLVSAGKYKTEANPFEPLSDEARQALQSKVNDFYGDFTKAVARGRGVGVNEVRSGFGEGRMISAQQAVKEKMADRVATLDQTLVASRRDGPAAEDSGPIGAIAHHRSVRRIAVEAEIPNIPNITFASWSRKIDAIHSQRARELELV